MPKLIYVGNNDEVTFRANGFISKEYVFQRGKPLGVAKEDAAHILKTNPRAFVLDTSPTKPKDDVAKAEEAAAKKPEGKVQ